MFDPKKRTLVKLSSPATTRAGVEHVNMIKYSYCTSSELPLLGVQCVDIGARYLAGPTSLPQCPK